MVSTSPFLPTSILDYGLRGLVWCGVILSGGGLNGLQILGSLLNAEKKYDF